ncbi:hypothetical protein EZV73_05655 [Acidaminobacter sp. JC074]|uniref:alpha-L-rhamnosidase n=1 Tax=Acidaminobacter sp. JC074 TaxID=2530199 RepID=UPI001F10FEF5|nr:alpha-L-rhamnosidase [Acidaminobacter sp. JC074]MCH4887043.1 hypothetical protein [Acidaminobacter sp. JC074]
MITDLRCLFQKNPIGIDEKPKLSWKLKDFIQTHYQLSLYDEDETLIYQTGKLLSKESVHIGLDYVFKPLSRYYFQVQVWSGKQSFLSKLAFFETGIMGKSEAKFISYGQTDIACIMFRKQIKINKPIKRARLYTSGLGVYEVYINSKKVGDHKLAPGWTEYQEYMTYQTYDVTHMLESMNVLGLLVADGWYQGHVSKNVKLYGQEKAAWCQLVLSYQDGDTEIIGSDESWESSLNTPFIQADLQNGEHYDGRIELDWYKNDFEPVKTGLDQMETLVKNPKLIGDNYSPVEILDIRSCKLISKNKNKSIYDFGQNMVGLLRIKLRGKSGDKLIISHGEMMDKDKLYTENLRSAEAKDIYIAKDGLQTYEPRFTFHGFRYAELETDMEVIEVKGLVLGSSLETNGHFICSNEKLNQLYSNILWGQKGNFFSIPTDCPQRDERLGWTGDAQVFSRTAIYNSFTYGFYKRYLNEMKLAQRSDGAIYDIAPKSGHHFEKWGNAAWADACVIIPYNLYHMYGDKSVIYDYYNMMIRWVKYYRDYREKLIEGSHIIASCRYGDWLGPEETPKEVVATAYYAYSVKLLCKLAGVIDHKDQSMLEDLHASIKGDFKDYLTDQDKILGDSQTAYLLAYKADLLDEDIIRKHLIRKLKDSNNHLTTGFVGVGYLCPVLSELGLDDLAEKVLLKESYPSWLYSVNNGATTIWERWDSYTHDKGFGNVNMNSFNHYAYGSIGEWFYGYLAGIRPLKAGFKEILIKPYLKSALEFVDASYESIYGKIAVKWTKMNGVVKLTVQIPSNTQGLLILGKESIELEPGIHDYHHKI